jgi:ribosomal-protein-alanine N-acetyltransferase
LNLRRLQSRDLDSVLAIQAASPEIAQWTLWDYQMVAQGQMAGWVAEEAGEAIGFLIARQIVTDVEILNFAVRPDTRRHGVGAALLAEAIDWGRALGAERALLEVRAANLAALQFYKKHHFQLAGRRARYYTGPSDDAVMLALGLLPS